MTTDDERMTAPSARPQASAGQRIGAFVVLLLAVVGVIAFWQLNATRPDPGKAPKGRKFVKVQDFAGSKSCAECHPGEAAFHAHHGHSHTLRRVSETNMASRLDGASVLDSEFQGATWKYGRGSDANSNQLMAYLNWNGTVTPHQLQFAFGSGQHAMTFVNVIQQGSINQGLEHRMTYYSKDRRLGLTPGQDVHGDAARETVSPAGRSLNPGTLLKCFGCHTTIPSSQGYDRVEPDALIPNVGCESCHGPAKAHVEMARKYQDQDWREEWLNDLKMPFNGRREETTDQEMRLCGQCHRHPSMAPSGSLRPDNPDLARFQPAAMMQSACYKQSNGQLRCVTCHDPHARPSSDAQEYNAKCLDCHQSPDQGQTLCPKSPKTGCVDCHMPRRDAGQHVLFADHWIRKPDPVVNQTP